MAPRRPWVKMAAPNTQPTFNYNAGRSLESSQIQDCSSGKLSKAYHTSTATVTAVRRELCLKGKRRIRIMMWTNRVRTVNCALLFCALQADFVNFSVVCYVGLVYPRPHFGLLSRGEAVRDEPAQYTLACGLRKRPRSFLMGSWLPIRAIIYAIALSVTSRRAWALV